MGPDAMILVFWMLSLSQLLHFPLSISSRGSRSEKASKASYTLIPVSSTLMPQFSYNLRYKAMMWQRRQNITSIARALIRGYKLPWKPKGPKLNIHSNQVVPDQIKQEGHSWTQHTQVLFPILPIKQISHNRKKPQQNRQKGHKGHTRSLERNHR